MRRIAFVSACALVLLAWAGCITVTSNDDPCRRDEAPTDMALVWGRTLTLTERPLPRVEVAVAAKGGDGVEPVAMTDDDGCYLLWLTPRVTYELWAVKTGYMKETWPEARFAGGDVVEHTFWLSGA